MDINCKPKILYIMGIDWNWIYQRPQIIEQHLEETNNITVIFPRSILKMFSKTSTPYPRQYKILWTLPLQEKVPVIGKISRILNKHIFYKLSEYEIIVIGYPLYYRYIPASYQGKLVYDCMDNHETLYPYPSGVHKVLQQEKRLAADCHVLLVSSQKLYQKMETLIAADAAKKIKLLRNGTTVKTLVSPRPIGHRDKYKLGYFGTIAQWFDYELLLKSLTQYQNIEYHLIGPVQKKCKQRHQRLVLEGTVAHDQLAVITRDHSCMIMPFMVDDIVCWVDPVKLYEYIALGKCIVSVRYPEIERFETFVYFYSNTEEYLQLLEELTQKGFPPKYNVAEQQEFLAANSWDTRFQELDALLKTLEET